MAQILNKRATGPGLTVLPSTTHTGVMYLTVVVMKVMEVQGKIVLLLTLVTTFQPERWYDFGCFDLFSYVCEINLK